MTPEEYSLNRLIHASIYFLKKTNHCQLTKLMKLLCFFDFEHYRLVGSSATGETYKAWKEGPVPVRFWQYLKNIEKAPEELRSSLAVLEEFGDELGFTILPKKKFDESSFTPRQLKILEKISLIFKESTAKQISKYSHEKNLPWAKTIKIKGRKAEIDYGLALEDLSQDTLSKEEVSNIQEEIDENRKLYKSLF